MYVMSTPMPELLEHDDMLEVVRRKSKWEIDDYICRGHILNGISDPMFDIYQNVKYAKELWDSIEFKYMVEDASSKKFLLSNFNNYKMVDLRPVIEQFNQLLRILGQYTQHGLKMDGSISVSSGGKNKNNKQNKGKKHGFKDNGGSGSNKKPKVACWKCGKTGHFKEDFRRGNKKDNASASGSGKGSKDHFQDQLIIEQRVKVNQKARILELKRRNYEEHCSDIPYAVSITEDMAYPCPKLHSASTKRRSIRRI
ncbi:zinc finger, CCHC-type containing protein [Tanacetum coccineum]